MSQKSPLLKIYKLLLLLYPSTYRKEYGRQIEQLFRDIERDAKKISSSWEKLILYLHLFAETAMGIIKQYIDLIDKKFSFSGNKNVSFNHFGLFKPSRSKVITVLLLLLLSLLYVSIFQWIDVNEFNQNERFGRPNPSGHQIVLKVADVLAYAVLPIDFISIGFYEIFCPNKLVLISSACGNILDNLPGWAYFSLRLVWDGLLLYIVFSIIFVATRGIKKLFAVPQRSIRVAVWSTVGLLIFLALLGYQGLNAKWQDSNQRWVMLIDQDPIVIAYLESHLGSVKFGGKIFCGYDLIDAVQHQSQLTFYTITGCREYYVENRFLKAGEIVVMPVVLIARSESDTPCKILDAEVPCIADHFFEGEEYPSYTVIEHKIPNQEHFREDIKILFPESYLQEAVSNYKLTDDYVLQANAHQYFKTSYIDPDSHPFPPQF